jgi:hypothetical protein
LRASWRSVFWPGLPDRLEPPRVDDHDLLDMREDDPSDRQRVAGRFKRHPVIRAQPLGDSFSWCGRALTRGHGLDLPGPGARRPRRPRTIACGRGLGGEPASGATVLA